MSNVTTLLVFLALAAVLGWLATRVRGKWASVALASLLSIGLVLGFAIQLSDTLQLYAPESTSKVSDQTIAVLAQAARGNETASFCEDCHSDLNKQPIESQAVSLSGDASLVFMPLEISYNPGEIDAQKIVAYTRWPGPDLYVVASSWSEADFIKAIRTGKDPQGHAIAREMPWRDVSAFATDEDLRAYFVFYQGSVSSDNSSH